MRWWSLCCVALLWVGCTTAESAVDAGAGGDAGPSAESADAGVSGTDAGTDAGTVAADGGGPAFRVALSVSPFSERLFANNLVISDGQRDATSVAALQAMYVAHGATEVFGRSSTARSLSASATSEDRSLARGVERAQLAHSLKLPFNPELGLWGSYGDVRCQPAPDFHEYPETAVPGPWESLTVGQMEPILRQYGALAAQAIVATGVKDIGNEVDFGVAGVAVRPLPSGCDTTAGPGWYHAPDAIDPEIGKQSVLGLLALPDDQSIAWLQQHLWPHEGRLLAAVAEGVRSVEPGARFSTHIARSSSPKFAVAFYLAMAQAGFRVDEAGFSVYPSANSTPGRISGFKQTVAAVQKWLGVRSFIAEYSYPARPMVSGPFASWNYALASYPISENGQADLLRDLASWGAATPA